MTLGWAPVGVHQIDLTLAPKGEARFHFLLGGAENPQEEKFEKPGVANKTPFRQVAQRFATAQDVDTAFAKLHAYWNDCLNLNCFSTTPGESFQLAGDVDGPQARVAESVMIAGLFCAAADGMADIYEHTGEKTKAAEMILKRSAMQAVITEHGWDGSWFLRAYDAFGEPYVYNQTTARRDALTPGEGKNRWLTGTASWCFVAISQYILGLRRSANGLVVDPCIPPAWKDYIVHRVFRGVTYHITVHNPNGVSKGVAEMTVNGQPIVGNVIPIQKHGDAVSVTVRMG